MKKRNLFICIICMVLVVAFTACTSQKPITETPTDVSERTELVFSENNDDVSVEEPVKQEEEKIQSDKTPESVVKNEPDATKNKQTSKTDKKEETTSKTDTTQQGDAVYNPVQYQSIEALENYLNRVANDKSQVDEFVTMQAQSGCYYRPRITADNNWVLSKITLHGASWNYYYKFREASLNEYDVLLIVFSTNSLQQHFDFLLNAVADNKPDYYCTTINNQKYAYKVVDTVTVGVSWQQYGYTHMATIKNCNDKLDQILPLLQVEKVSFKANDHVVQ